VAFVEDAPLGSALTFCALDNLPRKKLDVLARVRDFFTKLSPPPALPRPLVGLPSIASALELTTVRPLPALAPLSISVVAPARLSVRITRDVDLKEVFQSTIEFTGKVSDAAYLEPDGTGGLASSGWPDPDFYFFLTHSETGSGCWDAADAEDGGSGTYTVEITAEDAAGNLAYASTSVEVD
jgi:hypothetical protein